MYKKFISFFLLAISLFLMSPMLFAINNQQPVLSENVYTEDKTSITLTASKPYFTLKLKSNPTTGFSWFLRDYDQSYITPVKHYFKKSEEGLVGAPGYEYWEFVAKHQAFNVPIHTLIKLIYAKPWQSSDDATEIVFHISTVDEGQKE